MTNYIYFLGLAGFCAIIYCSITLIMKMEKIKQLQESMRRLEGVLNELDEQAKLIVRTDMELNRTQEDLDKKIRDLYALHRLSQTISTTLEESQIFKRIREGHPEELGFEKIVIFFWNYKDKKFYASMTMGFTQEEVDSLLFNLNLDKEFYIALQKKEKTFSSLSLKEDSTSREKINNMFHVISFVLSPILPKEGNHGFLFTGTDSPEKALTEGDEESITILANQIGQGLENARLFETAWNAQQEAEARADEKTRESTEALEQVNKVNRRKNEYISAVAHELRTPLTSIKGYAAILSTGKLGDIPGPVKERLEKINHHADELVNLINDLLDISRLESGKTVMHMEPLSLKNIADKVVDMLSVQAKERGVEIVVNLPQDYDVSVDRMQIERVFTNLIGNALKFTPEHGKITLSAYHKRDFIQVDIADTGIGIPPEAQESIFDEFYRVDNDINQRTKGTGLGLSLVKNIVEAHGGTIWVKSRSQEGSTFSFLLPSTETNSPEQEV